MEKVVHPPKGRASVNVLNAGIIHIGYAEEICREMESSALARGTGIAKRSPDYIVQKMLEGKAVIALDDN